MERPLLHEPAINVAGAGPSDRSAPPNQRAVSLAVLTNVRLYRDGLLSLVGSEPRLNVVGAFPDLDDYFEDIVKARPDIILLDVGAVRRGALVRRIQEAHEAVKLVVFGVADDEGEVLACAELGVIGYVSLGGGVEDLVEIVCRAAAGEVRCSPRVAAQVFRRYAALSAQRQVSTLQVTLTSRELDVISLMDAGCSNKEIARVLGVELTTVKHHVSSVLEKLGASRRSEAVARARQARIPFRSFPIG